MEDHFSQSLLVNATLSSVYRLTFMAVISLDDHLVLVTIALTNSLHWIVYTVSWNIGCFCFKGNELGVGTLTLYSQELKLPQHTRCHRELMPYADLMNWLKAVEHNSYLKLRKVRSVGWVVSVHNISCRFVCTLLYDCTKSCVHCGMSLRESTLKRVFCCSTMCVAALCDWKLSELKVE